MNFTASTSDAVTPDAGNTVAVVPRGSGGNRSPRPNSTLPSTEQHDGHQDQNDQVEQNQGHDIDTAGRLRRRSQGISNGQRRR